MNSGFQIDATKPREERDLVEFYPDLEEGEQLEVFIVENADEDVCNQANHTSLNPAVLKKAEFKQVKLANFTQSHKYSKAATDYGFQDPHRPPMKHTSTYLRPYALSKTNDTITEVTNKKRKLVEYDLDEQDILYADNRNSKEESLVKMPYEVFEILMTVLENLWSKLDLKMSLVELDGTSSRLSDDLTLANDAKYGQDDGIVQGPAAEQLCAVCNDSDCDNSNAIVFCDGCNIAVHQECYGVAFIPEGQWFCRKCMINKNREVHCIFCPSTTGAFKQLDSSLWSHVVCALWINELYFANPIYMEPIEGIDLIPKNRWKLLCYICKKRVGACIQCLNKNCFQAYHVTCAKRAGLFMQFTRGVQGAIHNKGTLRTFCEKHSPSDYKSQHKIQNQISKARLYFKDLKIINAKRVQLLKKQETDNRLNCFKWKTDNETPIAPEYFADVLYDKLIEMKLDTYTPLFSLNTQNLTKDLGISTNISKIDRLKALKDLSFDICRYWCLKRESRNGAPLIRKNNNMELSSIVYGSKELDEINDKNEFGKILIQDLKKVTDIMEEVVKRQKIILDQTKVSNEIFESVYMTSQTVCKEVLESIEKLDTSKLLLNYKGNPNSISLDQINFKVINLQYKKGILEMNLDLVNLCQTIKKENKFNSSIYRLVLKIERVILDQIDWLKMDTLINNDTCTGIINLPFVETTRNGKVGFKQSDVHKILEDEELSEVEVLDELQEDQLTRFCS